MDQTKAVAFSKPKGEQPLPSAEGEESTQPEYLTKAEAQRLIAEAEEKALRKAQSSTDKAIDSIFKKVQDDLRSLTQTIEFQRNSGIEVSPEQEQQLKQQLVTRALAGAPESAQPSPPQEAPQKEEVDPVTAEAWRMMEEAGVLVDEDDPEAKLLNFSSPYKFLKSIESAIEAKKERISERPARTPTNVGGRGAPTNSIVDVTDHRELLKRGLGGK